MPFEDIEFKDKIIWYYSNDGEYNVKSGYKVVMRMKEMAEASDMRNSESWWSSIWSMRVPANIKYFWWKVSHLCLPTNWAMCRKGINIENIALGVILEPWRMFIIPSEGIL